MAPEILKNQAYSYEVDVFGLAITAFILCTGEHPFLIPDFKLKGVLPEGTTNTTLVSMNRLKYADWNWEDVKISYQARDFIESIGNEFPEKRKSLTEISSHPFLTRKISIGKNMGFPTVRNMHSDSTAEAVSNVGNEHTEKERNQPAWVKEMQEDNRRLKFELKMKLNPGSIDLEDEDLMPVNPIELYTPEQAMAHMFGFLAYLLHHLGSKII